MINSREFVATRCGFTLLELVIVIAIALLLLSFFLGELPVSNELARRAKCKTNIKGIAEGCGIYMNNSAMHRKSEHGAAMPTVTPAPSSSNWGDGSVGNPSALWLLVRHELVGRESFLCPSAAVSRNLRPPGPRAMHFADDSLSYSYLSQVFFTDANTNAEIKVTSSFNPELKPAELAIIADANPRSQVGQQKLANDQRGANSLNHNRAGQNVGFLDGHADWFETTKIPGTQPLNNDNALDDIYQSAGSPADDASGRRGAINDAFLIP